MLFLFVFASGACALTYQVAWLRLLRLVFGTSTAASAAVLAIFMGGLGVGGLLLGRRADTSRNPVRLYALLEFGVAIAAALTPLLVAGVRMVYVGAGGSQTLGIVGGTTLRLALAALVLGVPTVLMGGTLPAMARAVESTSDLRRRHLGWLYGLNTLGAVTGAVWTTFVSLERLGTRSTIRTAIAVNLAIAGLALVWARRTSPNEAIDGPAPSHARDDTSPRVDVDAAAPPWMVIGAAGVVGFAFFVMELVWYRMLTPLLGGSSYTFGLILAIALAGIGLGGLVYGAVQHQRPATLTAFGLTCAIEAILIVLPYAVGDWIALFALAERQGANGFSGLVWGWSVITLIVVFPGALVAGYQFPLLVGLLGRGRERVGVEVGYVYASNSLGAIVGSLGGGFGLLPLLTAPGVWRTIVVLLAALSIAATASTLRLRRPGISALSTLAIAALAIAFCFAHGPTSFWRHSPIGAGRVSLALSNPNVVRNAMNQRRLEMLWEADGVESSVGVDRQEGIAFFVNGKSDGSAITDAPTQVMLGLIGAILHPNPKRALVIGLGTGETAGWLAQVPSIEAVDVFELEPAIVRVADLCGPVNHNAVANPKVHIVFGDARELLLTTRAAYDVIVSEPSNPYRAGTASLFTTEYYQAVAQRLAPGGVFMQWVQGYEVRDEALRSVYTTLATVFPSIETWELAFSRDLGFLASKETLVHDVSRVRARAAGEPYRSALAMVWGGVGAEAVYSGFVGNGAFAKSVIAEGPPRINTDDRTLLEFEFARSLGQTTAANVPATMRATAAPFGARPSSINGTIDWTVVDERLIARAIAEDMAPTITPAGDAATVARQKTRQAYSAGDFEEAARQWLTQPDPPVAPGDIRMVAEIHAATGRPRTTEYIEMLRAWQPAEAEAMLSTWYRQTGQSGPAVDHMIEAFRVYRTHPWTNVDVIRRAYNVVAPLLEENTEAAARMFEALAQPFAVHAFDIARLQIRTRIALRPALEQLCATALAELEPNVPWEEGFLRRRVECYQKYRPALVSAAARDLETFRANAAR